MTLWIDRVRMAKAALTLPTPCPHDMQQRLDEWHVCLDCGEIVENASHQVAVDGTAEPLTPAYPCAVCGSNVRWNDRGIWRCKACWPAPLTQAARRAAACEQAGLVAQTHTQSSPAFRQKPRDPRLGPVLLPCAACGEQRLWHDHGADTWQCWTCTPPVFRKRDHVLLVGLCEPLDTPVCQTTSRAQP
jgi:hypothetical protein